MAFSVLLLIPFRPCFVARIKECQQTEDWCIATVQVIVNYCDQRAKLNKGLLFVAEFSLQWYFERDN